MNRSCPLLILILSSALSGPTVAQVSWNAPGIIVPKTEFDRSEVKGRSEVWPRLDRGAVLCRTEGDLLRLAAARRGEAGPPANCQAVRGATPITILRRLGPGRTQVSVTGEGGQEGWTDAWLPERAPPIGGKNATIR